jgi:hypothetical protein
MSQKFKVGSIEHISFKAYGMPITSRYVGFFIDQNSEKVDLELYLQSLFHSRVDDSPASERERFAISTIESLSIVGRVSFPTLLHTASHFASKLKYF